MAIDIFCKLWYNIVKIQNTEERSCYVVSWEYCRTNPEDKEKDMFRLDELYDEDKDGINYTEEELEIIERIQKSGSI